MRRTHIDRGGTFTDVVVLDDAGGISIRKVPSDRAVMGDLTVGPLTFGTTVATNALLEGRGTRVLLVVTEGFADLVHIGDMSRPNLFDPDPAWAAPLCCRVAEVGGRLDPDGCELEAPRVPVIDLRGVDAVAVVLIHSPRNPDHELRVAAELRAQARAAGLAEPFVVLGHRVVAEMGYLSRIETTLVDAAITPVLRDALRRDRIPPGSLAMRSDGSVCAAEELRAPDALLSGPAGGVMAVAHVARLAGFERAVGLDMGGTSTDVCRVEAGALPRPGEEVRVAGVRIRRPVLEVETIAAGGGSILWADALGLRVGPESAGADPGPQCYGRGGPPTLTDAALVAGLIDPTSFDPPLDRAAVSLPGRAEEFLALARESMAQAVRRIALAKGVDLRDHALVSYGGAAGQHAAWVAGLLGIRTVLIHRAASVLSAFGLAFARREESAVAAVWRPLPGAWPDALEALARLEEELPSLGDTRRSVELRHVGTEHGIEVQLPPHGTPEDLLLAALEGFETLHRRRFGFDRPRLEVEVVNVRVRVAEGERAAPPAGALAADPWGLGDRVVPGPELIVTSTTAIAVPQGWSARCRRGLLRLDASRRPSPSRPRRRTPYGLSLWGARFASVAEQAGQVLRRLARSVNIRERLDFSCALFDPDGRLVANAPHIPVHLGAMGETVRDLLLRIPDPDPRQAYLSNDPAAGGSHLPDLTVVCPVRFGGRRFFVANRAHHVDVGGVTPGSMPPRATRLAEEGFVVRQLPLLEGGTLRDLREHLVGCRQPGLLLADLEAQIAANRHAARALADLGPADLVARWMAHLCDAAAEATARLGSELTEGRAEDLIDGVRLRLRLRRRQAGLLFDFSGTGGPHPGNLNAPPSVVRAAVLYTLRLLAGRALPLNEGALEGVEILVPRPSILAPPPGAAVAGGNVETSQRIVDLILRAVGARAASQGTMNNLTIGARPGSGEIWSLYETLGGGGGASAAGPGASGRQVHMTNTRATDPEVMETRFPLRVRRFGLRAGSGGPGRHPGGAGLVREIELLAPASASLLATRRRDGPQGMDGGGDGLPGRDSVWRRGRWLAWEGASVDLEPGDRVRVETPGGGGFGKPSASPEPLPPEGRSPRPPREKTP